METRTDDDEQRHCKHVVDASGVAVCGMPARQEQLVPWGEADCEHCAALYARRVHSRWH